MELGLSLGNHEKPFHFLAQNNTNHVQKNSSHKGSLDFCMALRLSSSIASVEEHKKKSQGNESDNDDEEASIGDEASDEEENTHLQLINLLPLAPVPWSSDNGSSENGLDVNRLPAEEVSSPFGIYRNKRDFESTRNDVVEGERASSRASDDDETGINGRKKLRLSKEQSAFLEESFKEHNTLNPKQKLALAKQLNLRPRQVEVWFQNRRARTKLKQTEVDCEYLKRCCETLSEENRRLHKELQELRALKASNPFYLQPPATTLTMCPSCERVATASSRAVDLVPKGFQFPLTRPRFYPFSQPSTHSNQPAAS